MQSSLNHLMPKEDSVLSLTPFQWILRSPKQKVASQFRCDLRFQCLLSSLQTWFQTSMRRRSRVSLTSSKLMHQCLKLRGSDNARIKNSSLKTIYLITNKLNKKHQSLQTQRTMQNCPPTPKVNNSFKSTSKLTKHWYTTRRSRKTLMNLATLTKSHSYLILHLFREQKIKNNQIISIKTVM